MHGGPGYPDGADGMVSMVRYGRLGGPGVQAWWMACA